MKLTSKRSMLARWWLIVVRIAVAGFGASAAAVELRGDPGANAAPDITPASGQRVPPRFSDALLLFQLGTRPRGRRVEKSAGPQRSWPRPRQPGGGDPSRQGDVVVEQ